MVVADGPPRGHLRVAWVESIGAGVWLRSIGDSATPSIINGCSGNDDRAPPSRDGAWAQGTGVADVLGVAGERGTTEGCRACDVTELLEAAPATTSVLPSL
jgi:hypothetical protein